jgi:hypothetical protein
LGAARRRLLRQVDFFFRLLQFPIGPDPLPGHLEAGLQQFHPALTVGLPLAHGRPGSQSIQHGFQPLQRLSCPSLVIADHQQAQREFRTGRHTFLEKQPVMVGRSSGAVDAGARGDETSVPVPAPQFGGIRRPADRSRCLLLRAPDEYRADVPAHHDLVAALFARPDGAEQRVGFLLRSGQPAQQSLHRRTGDEGKSPGIAYQSGKTGCLLVILTPVDQVAFHVAGTDMQR